VSRVPPGGLFGLCGAGAGVSLTDLDVLVVDCQATAAVPRGHLVELGWARVGATSTPPHTCLIRLPDGEPIPPAVTRVTGISERMVRDGVAPAVAWSWLCGDAARFAQQPPPAVAHFARFEEPFLRALSGGAAVLDLVCTHEIARRLLPDLPRRGLRALAGYFGRGVGPLRRCADHVDATAFVWRELVGLLAARDVVTWDALREWLAAPVGPRSPRRRAWPMPRDLRLSLPDAPGLYRLLRTSGDVLYVGKAASLRHRVNSHFRQQRGVHERTLEMLSQARALSYEVTPSALEAALLEPDEIKRHQPPYNMALTAGGRGIWFASPDLGERGSRPSRRRCRGPFASAEMLDQLAALMRGDRAALGGGRWAPDERTFDAGRARLRAAHRELSRADLGPHARWLQLGTRLWLEGRRDRETDADEPVPHDRAEPAWSPESVQLSLERLAMRAALAVRRARWLTALVEVAVVWCEPGVEGARLIVVERGDIVLRGPVGPGTTPPVPLGYRRVGAARRASFTLARYDRLRVLATELKRLVSEGAPVALRFDRAAPLDGPRLARALSWV
jgi:DNA polymerase-3 subunit epsilon